jgi:hypothetical protein
MQAHDELRQIQQEVSHITLCDSSDKWICAWGAQTFKTSAYYTFVFRDVQAHDGFKWLWKAKSIPKIKVFGWFLLSDRLNTCNMLSRRHYNIGDNLDCLLCNQRVEETVEHLFFGCTFSRSCWHLLGIHWPTQGNRLDMISHLKMRHGRKMIMDIFLVAAWSLWKERNNNYFRHVTPTVASWRTRFKKDFSDISHRLPPHKKHLVATIIAAII